MHRFHRLAVVLRHAALLFLLAALPAVAETTPPPTADPPALAWEYRFDFVALTRTQLGELYGSAVRALRVDRDGAIFAAMAVQTAPPRAGRPPPARVLLVAKLSAEGKLLWAKVFPAVPAEQISINDIGGGRVSVFSGPPEPPSPTIARGAGRILILRADGSVERNIAMRHPGPALIKERGAMEPNQYVIAAVPGRGDGFIIFGEYGPGPACWYLGALDRAGRRLWEHSGWNATSILTRVNDVRLLSDGRLEALVVRGALSERDPANAVLHTYNSAGRLAATKELARGTFGCYRFADAQTIVALYETELVWMRRDGQRLRTLPNSVLDCEFTQGTDGTLVWVDRNYDRKELKIFALAPGGERPSMTLISGGDSAAAAMRGGFIAVLDAPDGAPKDTPIVFRRYGTR